MTPATFRRSNATISSNESIRPSGISPPETSPRAVRKKFAMRDAAWVQAAKASTWTLPKRLPNAAAK